jgi:hypothetical protein
MRWRGWIWKSRTDGGTAGASLAGGCVCCAPAVPAMATAALATKHARHVAPARITEFTRTIKVLPNPKRRGAPSCYASSEPLPETGNCFHVNG